MTRYWFLVFYLFLYAPICVDAQTVPLTIRYACSEINQGYDYAFKVKLFIDGRETAESEPQPSSRPGKLTVQVPAGYHHIRITGYKNYEGRWEASLKSNNYTVDSQYEQSLELNGPTEIELQFNMATGTRTRGFIVNSTAVTNTNGLPLIPRKPK